jgi:hypothetical protein
MSVAVVIPTTDAAPARNILRLSAGSAAAASLG